MMRLSTQHADLDTFGSVPEELDGLLLLMPDVAEQSAAMHVLRLHAGRCAWLSSIAPLASYFAKAEPAETRYARASSWTRIIPAESASRILHVRRSSETQLEWSLHSGAGEDSELGLLGIERERDIVDLSMTSSWLVLLSVTRRESGYSYQVGMAARHRRTRVQWLAEEASGWPELLHVRESAGALHMVIAVREEPAAHGAHVLLSSVDPHGVVCTSQRRLEKELAAPRVTADAAAGGGLYICGLDLQRDAKNATPALISGELLTGQLTKRDFALGRELGAPAIVAGRPGSGALVLLPVHDAVRDTTECWVLDAAAPTRSPFAIINLGNLSIVQQIRWFSSQQLQRLDTALGFLAALCN